jgi:heme/copper-type cytochrome/quinol oxidase subunit 3
MSTVESSHYPLPPDAGEFKRSRAFWGMVCFIASEATLFVLLFYSYFYLGASNIGWPTDALPRFKFSVALTAILIVSSITLLWGQRGMKEGSKGKVQGGIMISFVLAVAFLVVQVFEYREHLRTLKPSSGAYGSIFYTITSIHILHLTVGAVMLLWVWFLLHFRPIDTWRRELVHNVSLYWHFVGLVWIFIFWTLYVTPHLTGGAR